MNLIIDADLTNPPSEVAVFRDVTLYSKVFLKCDVLLECEHEDRDIYYYWLKRHGAFDFVDDFINFGEEYGVTIRAARGTISTQRLDAFELNRIISLLKRNVLYL